MLDSEKQHSPSRPGTLNSELGTQNPELTYPSLLQGFGLIGLIIVFQLSIALATWQYSLAKENQSLYFFMVYTATFSLTLLIALLIRKSWKFQFVSFSGILLVPLLLFTAATFFSRELIIGWIPGAEKFAEMLSESFGEVDAILIITIGIIGPILEELIFRGVVLDGFLKRYSPEKAIIWSAILFGVAHLNPYQFISAFMLGAVIGWTYWKTNSIIPAIIIHVFNNLFAFVPHFALGYGDDLTRSLEEIIGNSTHYWIIQGVALIVAVLAIWWAYVLFKRLTPQPPIHSEAYSPDSPPQHEPPDS